jgi:hypothetical protein
LLPAPSCDILDKPSGTSRHEIADLRRANPGATPMESTESCGGDMERTHEQRLERYKGGILLVAAILMMGVLAMLGGVFYAETRLLYLGLFITSTISLASLLVALSCQRVVGSAPLRRDRRQFV